MRELWVRSMLLIGSFSTVYSNPKQDASSEKEAAAYLTYLNKEMDRRTNLNQLAQWAYVTNMNKETLAEQAAVASETAKFQKEEWIKMMKYPWKTYRNADIKRQFFMFSILGVAALPEKKFAEYQKVTEEMKSIYSQAKVCSFKNRADCEIRIDPGLTNIMADCRDPEELKYYWLEWHKASGGKLRHLFPRYVELFKEAAVLNNLTDTAALWLWSYEDERITEIAAELWSQLKPLYTEIHAYVRGKLREKYGEKVVPKKKPIPAHLLGNMWAQQWYGIADMVAPFPGNISADVTPQMRQQGYTTKKMFELAEDFYTSINLSPMTEMFWKYSVLEKPKDRNNIICEPSAFDFYDGKDYRIKQCTTVTYHNFRTAHHEMGHIEYFMQYKNQPFFYKNGANEGFHEAIGDAIVLSMQTPEHMKRIGLMDPNTVITPHAELNDLFNIALRKIILLPFAYIMDLWRWDVFRGKISKDQYNCAWWKLRSDLQGIEPPVDRSEVSFDPGAKFHIAAGVEYLRYFISFVIQFQFHQAMCEAAGQFDKKTKPLHRCNIYQSKEAGALLKNMLQLGSSLPWPKVMKLMTGQSKMDATPLLRYFRPLQRYLEKENKHTGEYVGWTPSERKCTKK